ncbi:hypothetical protein MYP_674 [Sporocytophaga myxococcoides]|uniref:DUF1643 domain-containing protein n=1 Tax=Sporocytophaga myxococcoides TaxID=153721 RepID=A0A098LAI5_9BACT|nr:DUF1643 domain-containing protein [Sporocytophaga myxococcoides]GAL83447.1 hypothetical protein MYP_674 [Sporocytophaga myxococcoides]
MKNIYDESGAIISTCKNYRYRLWRIWDKSKPFVMFIMHNPSTADESEDDRTIKRCVNFAKSWGYGGIYVGNIFAYRSTKPEVIKQVIDPIGPDNNKHLTEMLQKCQIVIAAWGNHPKTESKPLKGIDIGKFYYLSLTKTGNPRHPLYLKMNLKPQKLTKI